MVMIKHFIYVLLLIIKRYRNFRQKFSYFTLHGLKTDKPSKYRNVQEIIVINKLFYALSVKSYLSKEYFYDTLTSSNFLRILKDFFPSFIILYACQKVSD